MTATSPPASRFLQAAQACRRRDLERLSLLGGLIQSINELIHGLQRERGVSSIVLGSQGASFRELLLRQVEDCRQLEYEVRARLEQIERVDGVSFGARFYMRGAQAFGALDTLLGLREQIGALKIAPQDAVKAFSDLIGCLLAVGFEVADIAADPEISRALIALANFAQGKEFAGQERATAGAAFSCGHFEAIVQRRLRELVAAQDQAFRVFSEFAVSPHAEAFQKLQRSADTAEVRTLRRVALGRDCVGATPDIIADTWFRHSTARIDAMKALEDQMTADLKQLCASKLMASEATGDFQTEAVNDFEGTAPVAMLAPDVLTGGVGLYTLDGILPRPMRSIMDVVHAQTRQLNDVSHQLESARAALTERKAIERAKGLLMETKRLSEKQAYNLLRDTAMNQNKRMYEVAEAIISMAEILRPRV